MRSMGAFQVSTDLLTCTRMLSTSVRWCFGLSAHTLPALGLALLEKFTNREASFHKASLRYNLSLFKAPQKQEYHIDR